MEIGVDIIEIDRIKKACKHKTFKTRFFTKRELEGIKSKRNYQIHLAGKFAAKEAVAKSLGTGFRNFKLRDIEILNDTLGKPQVVLSGEALQILKSKGFNKILITISHCREYAVAFALALEGGVKNESCKSSDYEGNGQSGYRNF